jgi:HD superfamily phosphodiesterase
VKKSQQPATSDQRPATGVMKPAHKKIWELARPYLNTRKNDIHTEISVQMAYKLMQREGGDEDIVIPAIILHDVGWSKIPENLQLKAFGPKAVNPELNRVHEIEGRRIAGEILETVNYGATETKQIIEIIEGHDSRREALFLNDMIVKDADKLWRYTKSGVDIDVERFGETFDEGLERLRININKWFYTHTAREFAEEEVRKRAAEPSISDFGFGISD